ncbi:hypothetical protein LPJ61_003916 [Coemansia biformis]|uniref:Uncharacterized protein n=1 Tax=Coemansia biformis TaxID=1286918 RepID=A0A9W7YAB8_9FUNG|nr:hypothetical protein LPJ61_003916 [Coemansia biformis]
MIVWNSDIPILPTDFTCSDLTHLALTAPTNIRTILGLITIQPSLERLILHNITLDDIPPDITIPERGAHEAMVPLNASIDCLQINFVLEQLVPELVILVTKYLLLRLPALLQVHATQIPYHGMGNFVGEYAQWYPHLRNIGLTLTGGEDWPLINEAEE